MANLLPTKERAHLDLQRRRRLISAVVVLASGVCAFGTVLLIPSIVALTATRQAAAQRLTTTRELIALQEHAGAGSGVAATKEKMEMLARYRHDVAPHELIAFVRELLPEGVTLSAVTFARQEEEVVFAIAGEARDRASLIAFGDALKQTGRFSEVTIPIESLARATNLQFRLSLSLAASVDASI